jgi:hypothetical protein
VDSSRVLFIFSCCWVFVDSLIFKLLYAVLLCLVDVHFSRLRFHSFALLRFKIRANVSFCEDSPQTNSSFCTCGMDVSVVYSDSVVCSVVVDKSLKSDRTYGFCAFVLRIGFTHSFGKTLQATCVLLVIYRISENLC